MCEGKASNVSDERVCNRFRVMHCYFLTLRSQSPNSSDIIQDLIL